MFSVAFAVALRLVGARVNTVFYPNKTHTDLFLQVFSYSLGFIYVVKVVFV